eukprot:9515781-Karenia_brevis.AAC.1
MNAELQDLTRSSDAAICEVLAPYFFPEVQQLKQGIDNMKAQIKATENQLEAVQAALQVAFAEVYYNKA